MPSAPDRRAACPITLPVSSNGRSDVPARLCVIDLGTNSFHAIIVDAYPNGTFVTIDKLKEMVRLGERGLKQGRLTKAGMDRSVRALRRIKQLAEGRGCEAYRAFATSAIREAENGGDLIVRVRREVGLSIRPITGQMEAQLIHKGVRRALALDRPAVLIDIGGGSTEFIVTRGGGEAVFSQSFKLGAARMTNQFISTDPAAPREFRALRAHYREVLQPVFEAAREVGARELVGSSGTMENLAEVARAEFGDGGRGIEHQAFDGRAFRRTTKAIMRSGLKERQALAGIDAKRLHQIVAGATLADVVIKDLDLEHVRISPAALREGIVEHYLEENHGRLARLAPYADPRRRSVYELAFSFRWEGDHAATVAAFALQLFDALREVHGLGLRERELLEYATLLHNIGHTISRSAHHKHSRYLILHADLRGFQPEEVQVMAYTARYHRRALPKKKHEHFQALPGGVQDVALKLAALLRIASALNRSHNEHVQTLETELTDEALRLTLHTRHDAQLEVWAVRRSQPLFEGVYDLDLEVEVARIEEDEPEVEEALAV